MLLQLSHVSVGYGSGSRALSDISLEMASGEIVALLGPNGSGKTTALRAISGLLQFHGGRIEEGQVTLRGLSLQRLDAAARVRLGVAQVMEGRRVFAEMSVADNLMSGAHTRASRGATRVAIEASFDRVLGYFPLLKDRLAGAAGFLSGGEQQMLAIGRALMSRPKVLLLDEPSLGLAPILVREIFRVIREIREQGMTIVLVEQNARMALSVADRGYVLETGVVCLADRADALLKNPEVQAAYLGGAA